MAFQVSEFPQPAPRKLLSRREYAAARGVSHTAVNNAVSAGKIPLVDGRIDAEVADRAWLLNRDGGQSSPLAEGIAAAAQETAAAYAVPPAASSPDGFHLTSPEAPEPGTRAAAELRTVEAKAELAEILAAERRGEVVRVAEVREALSNMISQVKARLLLIPGKVGMKHGLAVQAEVKTLIESALLELSDYPNAAAA